MRDVQQTAVHRCDKKLVRVSQEKYAATKLVRLQHVTFSFFRGRFYAIARSSWMSSISARAGARICAPELSAEVPPWRGCCSFWPAVRLHLSRSPSRGDSDTSI